MEDPLIRFLIAAVVAALVLWGMKMFNAPAQLYKLVMVVCIVVLAIMALFLVISLIRGVSTAALPLAVYAFAVPFVRLRPPCNRLHMDDRSDSLQTVGHGQIDPADCRGLPVFVPDRLR